MRRSICYCEPHQAIAGEANTWSFVYTPAIKLPKKAKLKFDIFSDGREVDWEIPSINLQSGKNILYAILPDGKTLAPREIKDPDGYPPQYEFVLPSDIDAGANFVINMGSPKATKGAGAKQGNRAQVNAQRRRPFYLHVDTNGKGYNDEPEIFNMDIRGNNLHTIRIITPSFVARNKRFDVTVRFEDEFGNLTSLAPEDTLIELTHDHLRENLNWKLFVPETGFVTLPNMYFNESGIYTIQLHNSKTKETFRSSPIKCFEEAIKSIFWGNLHSEFERSDAAENIENCLRHIRDEQSHNFFATSPFEEQEETPNDIWRTIVQTLHDFDESDRFSCFVGYQWKGESPDEGIRQIVYLKDQKQIIRKKDPKGANLNKLYANFSPKEMISIPSFTMGKGSEFNFKHYNPEYERVAEIYNAWGSSEKTKGEGNPFPITSTSKKGVKESPEGSLVAALNNNCRFGFVAGGLDDRGVYADFFETDQHQYSPGVTAIIAKEHTKAALADALYRRSCYATTGDRIILGMYVAGQPMGSELDTSAKRGLKINRHINGYVAGTETIQLVEIIRNGKVLQSYHPTEYSFEFEYDDMEPLEKVVIKPKDKKPPFVYYYLRVTQVNGQMGWSSPIWVDLVDAAPASPLPAPKNES